MSEPQAPVPYDPGSDPVGDPAPEPPGEAPLRGARGRRGPGGRRVALAALLLALLGACATTAGLREERGEGLTRFYGAPLERVWEAALRAVEANGLRLDRADRGDRFIAATHLPTGDPVGEPDESVAVSADQGERVGIFVDSVAPGAWSVEVVTRRRFALDPTSQDWTRAVFRVIERELGPDARLPGPPRPDPARTDTDRTDTDRTDTAPTDSIAADSAGPADPAG